MHFYTHPGNLHTCVQMMFKLHKIVPFASIKVFWLNSGRKHDTIKHRRAVIANTAHTVGQTKRKPTVESRRPPPPVKDKHQAATYYVVTKRRLAIKEDAKTINRDSINNYSLINGVSLVLSILSKLLLVCLPSIFLINFAHHVLKNWNAPAES